MEADNLWRLILLKMALHRIAHMDVKAFQVVRLGKNGFTERACLITPSGVSSTRKMISFIVFNLLPG